MAEILSHSPEAAIAHEAAPFTLPGFKVQSVIIALLAIVFYCNTFNNEYALDDTAVIVSNEFVHQGFAGIPGILTKDVYYSYYHQLNTSDQLTGGRYRPLSVVTFALEQQLFGPVPQGGVDSVIANGIGYEKQLPYEQRFIHEMHVRHVVNVLLYALLGIVLLYFLRYIVLKNEPLMALVATVTFIIHPLHTEVVANVKSRDEIMSLLFICLTFIASFRYLEFKKVGWLIAALVCYFLAFLSKEYAITLLALLPLSFYLFGGCSLRKCLMATLPFLAVVVVYIIIRLQVIGPRSALSDSDIQINPYALATGTEKIASEIAVMLSYLRLLIFPHPLSSDYSFNQIPYSDFSNPMVWLSLAVHLGLVACCVYFLLRKHVLGFAIAFYLANLLMVCNLVFDIGATMGERLIFHASAGFAIAVAWLLVKGLGNIRSVPVQKLAWAGVMLPVIVLCGFKTIQRNKDWKNDNTLFMQDINVSPNSFLVNVNVATMLVNQSDFEKDDKVRTANLHRAVALYTKVFAMQNNYVLGYLNRCVAYYKLDQPDSMVADLNTVTRLYPIHPLLPEMYFRAGTLYFANKKFVQADSVMQFSQRLNPNIPAVKSAINDIEDSIRSAK